MSESDDAIPATFCCTAMDTWSLPTDARQMFYHTNLNIMHGIIPRHVPPNSATFVSIAFCPFCGTRLSFVEDALIGMQMAELT